MPDDTSILHTDARVRRLVEEARAEGWRAGWQRGRSDAVNRVEISVDAAYITAWRVPETTNKRRWEARAKALEGAATALRALTPPKEPSHDRD